MTTREGLQLIAFDKNRNLQFEGRCKIQVNPLSSLILIQPHDEAFKLISALFKWNFVMQKNLLFVFAEYDFLDCCLVFKNEILCQTVYGCIPSQKETVHETLIEERFLVPIFDKIAEDAAENSDLIEIIADWTMKLDGEYKQSIINLMKDKEIYELFVLAFKNSQSLNQSSIMIQKNNSRKRNSEESENGGDASASENIEVPRKKKKTSAFTEIKKFPEFKLMNCVEKGLCRSLLIFTSPKLSKFYEYKWNEKKQLYICHKCQWNSAILDQDESGELCARFSNDPHKCKPCRSIPELYIEIRFLKKPDYEIMESYVSGSEKIIVVFDPIDKKMCYEYIWDSKLKIYICRQCSKSRSCGTKKIKANICNEETAKEYLELINENHVCEKGKYSPEKYRQFFKYVLEPDFEIQTFIKYGAERKRLIIFDQDDRNLCYEYILSKSGKYYVCHRCLQNCKRVTADLCQNSDGEKYILLSNTSHICELKSYDSFNQYVLHPPKIELMEATKNGVPKLFVFKGPDKQKCYIFSLINKKRPNMFYCLGCRDEVKKGSHNFNKIASGYLKKEDEDESYNFRMKQIEHICKRKKYQPELFLSCKSYDFFFYRSKQFRRAFYVALYHPEKKENCYTFKLDRAGSFCFYCVKCKSSMKSLSTRLQRDANGKKYFNNVTQKHICEPVKVSSICEPNFTRLERIDINLEKEPKMPPKIDESRIIKLPNFELQPNKYGIPEKKLIVFRKKNKKQCYVFCLEAERKFICLNCKKLSHRVAAKLHHDDQNNNEKFIVMETNDHICKAMPYRPANTIVESPNFLVLNRHNKTKPTKLFVFTSDAHDFCYEYTYLKAEKIFRCVGCCIKKKYTTAKLIEKEDGENLVELRGQKHKCKIRKFKEPKFRPKPTKKATSRPSNNNCDSPICLSSDSSPSSSPQKAVPMKSFVPFSMFELVDKNSGEKNKKLIIFDTDYHDTGYIYYWYKGLYYCSNCRRMKKFVTAKLNDEMEDQTFLELNNADHVCSPVELQERDFETKSTTIPAAMFEMHRNINGEKNKKIIVFASQNDKDMGYAFNWVKSKTFRCGACKKLNKYVSVTLREAGKKSKCLETGTNEHVCEPKPYDSLI